MDKILEKLFGKTPGLDVVVLVVTTFMLPLVLRKVMTSAWDLLVGPTVWLGALILSRGSAKWDDWLFDPRYGPVWAGKREQSVLAKFCGRLMFPVTICVDRCKQRKALETGRQCAERAFNYPDIHRRREGIYESAQSVFHGTEQWEKEIRPYLEFSKAARVFLWPLIIALGWVVMHDRTGSPPYIRVNAQSRVAVDLIGLTQYWFVIYLCLQAVAFLYLYLRITHMRKLYGLVSDATIFAFELNEKGNRQQVKPMFRVGTIVVPVDALRIFKRRILCVGAIDQNHKDVLKQLRVPCLEIKAKEATTQKDVAKLVRADKADLYVVDSSLLAGLPKDFVRKLTRGRQVAVYPDIKGEILIVPDTEFNSVNVATKLERFLNDLS
jgi:hypothetical protein